ncbi:MAG: ABC transporter permease [Halobacteriota archaeon]
MRGAWPVARRILLTLRGDGRTLGLVLVMPVLIIYLLGEVFPVSEPVAPVLLGVFVFVLTYVLTAIGFLRERTMGTLDRVLVAPISEPALVTGYLAGYGLLAAVQAAVLLAAGVAFLDVSFAHGVGSFFLVALLGAGSALGLGFVLSLFAQNEFQVLQFMPTVIGPQVILGGTFRPVEELPAHLEWPARLMPVTYVIEGMNYVLLDVGEATDLYAALLALAAFTAVAAVVAWRVIRTPG